MRMPKRGFNKPNKLNYVETNLGRIQAAIDSGRLSPSGKIDGKALVAAGVIRREEDGVRLLGSGEIKAKLDITVAHASAGAKAAVAKAGGSVTETIAPKAAAPAKEAKKAPEKKKAKKASEE
jgi:large subunit ribosomal protein L15